MHGTVTNPTDCYILHIGIVAVVFAFLSYTIAICKCNHCNFFWLICNFLHCIVVIPGLLTDGTDIKQCNPDPRLVTVEKVASPGRVVLFAVTILFIIAIDFQIISDIEWHVLFAKCTVQICRFLSIMGLFSVYNILASISLLEFQLIISTSSRNDAFPQDFTWRKAVDCSSAIVGRGVFLASVVGVDVFLSFYSFFKYFRNLILSSRSHHAIFAGIIASTGGRSHPMVWVQPYRVMISIILCTIIQ